MNEEEVNQCVETIATVSSLVKLQKNKGGFLAGSELHEDPDGCFTLLHPRRVRGAALLK